MHSTLNIIERLKSLDLQDPQSAQSIRELLMQISIPLVNAIISTQTLILRARRGRGYTKREDMTYKRSTLCTSYQRASIPFQTTFYGSISDNQRHQEDARAIGVSECSILANQGIDSIGREYLSVSQWIVKEQINIACIVSDNAFVKAENKLLQEINQSFKNKFSDDKDAIIVANYIEKEFTKQVLAGHDSNYQISAIISDILLNVYGFDAIAYPSVKLGGQAGLNLAIRPDIVDSKLELINIAEQCYYKNGKHGIVRIENIYDVLHNCYVKPHQISNEDLCKYLGINKLEDLNLIK